MREARLVMAELALSGLSPDQLALVMELSACLGAEAAPQRSRKAVNQSAYRDRKRQQTATNGNVVAEAEAPPPNEYISNPLPVPQSPKGDSPKKKTRARSDDFEVPAFVPAEPWAAFAAMRKAKKKPIDSYMAARHFGKLKQIADAGWNLVDVIDKATNGFWDGFWMPDGKDPNIRRASGQPLTEDEQRARQLNTAETYERIGRTDEAEEIRRRWATGPPRPIGDLVKRMNIGG